MYNIAPNFQDNAQALKGILNDLPASVPALAQFIYSQRVQAYQNSLQQESSKWGVAISGALSPFLLAQIMNQAQQSATSIASTYMQSRNRAIAANTPLYPWQMAYMAYKSHQVLLNEYSSSHSEAQRAFYTNSTIGEEMIARVIPGYTNSTDECLRWIGEGWVPLERTYEVRFPNHTNCYHAWFIQRKSDQRVSVATADITNGPLSVEEFAPAPIHPGGFFNAMSGTFPLIPTVTTDNPEWNAQFDGLYGQAQPFGAFASNFTNQNHQVAENVTLWLGGMVTTTKQPPPPLTFSDLQTIRP